MNKILKYACMAATALTVAACTEDYKDWKITDLSSEEEAPVTVPGVTASTVGTTIDLANAQGAVQLFNLDLSGLDEDMTVADMVVTLTPEGATKDAAPQQVSTSDGCVDAELLQELVKGAWGQRPVERTFNGNVILNVMLDGAAMRVNAGDVVVKAVPLAPYISNNYYVIGAPSEWNPSCTTLPFNHSSADVYDDPVFTVTFPVAAGETWFAITDDKTLASGEWSDVLGCAEGNGNNGMDGYIARRSELSDDGSWKVVADDDCSVKMTINMMDYSYQIEFIHYKPFIYFIGATDGWSNAEQKLALVDTDNGVYTGFIYCADPNGWGNQFKFQQVAGDWGTELNNSHFTTYSGAATDCGGNLGVSGGENVYYFSVNLSAGVIYAEEVTKMGIIGDFNSWGGDLDMTWNAAEYCYEANISTVTANGWKFRINADWAVNLGGDTLADLVANGANLTATGTTCKLYPTRRDSEKIYCTVE